ncbi:uncharacterized protein BT62DRAFT_122795 [Guyanagaster necrorhizus]|uniref:Uncharacterized protein n=1 Tax=Guyanagaster necrorhizus TaxID=856835 RepID=A0A9P7VV84_9AGAR|nr:uncharacterized protein BT62DRAFT_122795 [Guyanagaster necrorhizus MCA 3950]KAG7446501.1 hypothetical protein BT62DRAFT_122795 [Guyanagaster necrorhizus MCA 3950]
MGPRTDKPAGAQAKPHRPSINIPPTPDSATSSQSAATVTPSHAASSNFSVLASATILRDGADLLSATKSAIPPEIEAVAQLMHNLKEMNHRLKGMYESIETNTERAAMLGPVIKAGEETATLRSRLEKQIAKHAKELETLRRELERRVKERLEDRLKQHVTKEIRASVAQKIENKVRQELEKQVPHSLRHQTNEHTHQMVAIKTHLHNSEARRINATLTRKEKLRPLIPLDGSTLPASLFPNNIDACLAMSGKDVKELLKHYELDKASPVPPGGTSKEENINKFLDYIGAPYHVLPGPTVPESASSKGPRLVAPILITRKAVV